MNSQFSEDDVFYYVTVKNGNSVETFKWWFVKGYSDRWGSSPDMWYYYLSIHHQNAVTADQFRTLYPLSTK